ncbi:AraC family transcriptional regulator [Variovorax sp. KK3]|uniref:AraC family transcriptional regulator n=1 Tax=Variovorax sp. KK3 TaxID=1855728 RepID=UPI00097BC9AB|nr:AraC family transcriptional regulator [Variovorax sp. KK3]
MDRAPAAIGPIAELAALVDRFTRADGIHTTPIERLLLVRQSRPSEPLPGLHQPALCIIVQGAKQVMLRDEVYRYDASCHLVVSVDLPVMGQIVEATPEAPYLCLRLDLDPGEIASLMLQTGTPAAAAPAADEVRGLFLARSTPALLDATLRLVRLLATPEDIGALAPLAEREILYRLLRSEQGPRLAQIATAGTHAHRIAHAIGWLKQHFARPLRIEEIAREVHMSASSLHHHFRAVTAMSPLQFQKQLRLQEARRLMLSETLDAATACHRVGYESPSQFSREYARLFGAPPGRDRQRLREQA